MLETKTAVRTLSFLIDGKWFDEAERVEIRSPFDHSVVARVAFGGPSDVEAAIVAAQRAFEKTRHMAGFERQQILKKTSEGMAARKEDFARMIALEAGKPIKAARQEVDRAALTFAVAAEEATRIGGEVLPLDLQEATRGRWGIVRRFPLGPIAAITPFNFPLNLVAHKVAPAIAAGCTVVLKPAPQTPGSALLLAELMQQSGLPDGALNVLPLANEHAHLLVRDDRFKLLSFTGSSAVGWQLKAQAGKKKVVLELGGNAGVIIHSDADVPYAVERCVAGGFSYAGQSCISVQRIFVHRSVLEHFLELLLPVVRKLKTGDPMDEATDVGPMIRESDATRAMDWISEALEAGAQLACGGTRRGSILQPAVLTHTTREMKVNCAEVFAPVVTVTPYDDFDAALAAVNDSPYGLQAGVFTHDVRLLFRAHETLEAGGVIANDVPTFRIDHMPYGGVKDSGLGREGLRYAIEEMTEPRLLVLNPR